MLDSLSPAQGSSCGQSMISAPGLTAAQPLVSFGQRLPIIPGPVQNHETPQALANSIDRVDESSLMPASTQYAEGTGVWYTLCLKLRPSEASHPSYRYRVHRKELHLAFDTADSSFWLYQKDFQELYKIDENTVGGPRPWSEQDARKHAKRRCLPRPDMAPMGDCVRMTYSDGGMVDLARYPAECDLTFAIPSWDWRNNRKSMSTELQFPQILAQAASGKAACQPVDGNVGFAVPGYRHPWDHADEMDRVTFFDILHQADCVEGVVDIEGGDVVELQLIVRLLYSSGRTRLGLEDRTRSFLYFGRGTPCGLSYDDGMLFLPEFSPAMRIFPDMKDPKRFRLWTLQLRSITLLEPLVDNLDHESCDDHQWSSRRINALAPPDLLNMNRLEDLLEDPPTDGPGIPVAFDSCSGCSVLPRHVVSAIWTGWFGQNFGDMPADRRAIWHNGTEKRFFNHDLLFDFIDGGGKKFTIRCSAQPFLSSPWSNGSGGTQTCIMAGNDPEVSNDEMWTLGMNFFWAFMIKFETTYIGHRPVPGTDNPTVRFAAQRIVSNGIRIAGADELKILQDVPPRLQNDLRGTRIPELHPGDDA
ncbi:hypothetical protein OH76DRAFT_1479272 [Lentinus brumalis]|uniref:Uncharacterized protein n=1 Tax=Lentinus brumalis TaxID=2498619 RepID=A0A371DNZ5_9APHY|nr:hypothetical protein OH76DRAFT_1479272 [Polyporus brumalis]